MNTFPIPTVPLPDESLIGFVARACDNNGHPSVTDVLGLAGFKTLRARFLSVSNSVDLEGLAAFFGCHKEDLRWRLHLPTDVEGCPPKTFVDYFGSPVRRLFREPSLRRVSPASLRQSAHHRAIGMIRPLTYCPESGEMLISQCPNPACGKPLRWNYAFGINFCEFCLDEDSYPTTDLRDFDQPKLPCDDLEVYRWTAALLGPHGARGPEIPPFFQSWHGWEIFDMAVMLATILARRSGDRATLSGPALFAQEDWHQNFMTAARAVLKWPDGVKDIVTLMKEFSASRSGYYSRSKELGPLAAFGKHYGALPKAAAALRSAVLNLDAHMRHSKPERAYQSPVDRSHEFLSYREAIQKHKISTKLLTSIALHDDIEVIRTGDEKFAPTYFNERQLVELLETRKQLLPIDRLRVATGLPMFAILGLIGSGHILIAEGAIARFRDTCVHPSEIDRFRNRIENNATKFHAADGIPLTKAILAAGGAGGGLLLTFVQRCLDGKQEYSLANTHGKLASRIMLPARAWKEIAPVPGEYDPTAPTPAKMSRGDVEVYLDMPYEDIVGLIDCGLLKDATAERGRLVDGESVRIFNEAYFTTTTVGRRLKRHVKTIKKYLDEKGVAPAHSVKSPNRPEAFIWRRSDIEPLLGEVLRGKATRDVGFLLAPAVGLEPTDVGFGDRCSGR